MDEKEEIFTKEFLEKAKEFMRKSFQEGHWLPPLSVKKEQEQEEDLNEILTDEFRKELKERTIKSLKEGHYPMIPSSEEYKQQKEFLKGFLKNLENPRYKSGTAEATRMEKELMKQQEDSQKKK